jgi:hypothetical protein
VIHLQRMLLSEAHLEVANWYTFSCLLSVNISGIWEARSNAIGTTVYIYTLPFDVPLWNDVKSYCKNPQISGPVMRTPNFLSNFWHYDCNLTYKVQSVTTMQERWKGNGKK